MLALYKSQPRFNAGSTESLKEIKARAYIRENTATTYILVSAPGKIQMLGRIYQL